MDVIAETLVNVDVAQTLTALGALFVVAGVPALFAARRSKHTASRVSDIADQVATNNGNDIGGLVEETHKDLRAVARLMETIDGRVHDLSKRIDAQQGELGAIHQHQAAMEAQFIAQGDVLQSHIDTTKPLADWVQQQLLTEKGE